MTDAPDTAKYAAAAAKNAEAARDAAAAKRAAVAKNAPPAVPAEKPAPAPKRSRAELQQDTLRARADLAATLDAIEDKLNVPKQIGLAAERGTERVRRLAAENPIALGAIALGVAAVVGLGVWGIVRAVRR
ncbi:DUF3618 domain-containing protein [Microterricola viridarii]|uniref:DUF3618 domain-containing protein n=1 Tax=Microterricola viridarii TaxID=412690 RepID=A0A1H1LQG9_9MICO|nr:DUF3618 domain-containing protein [Microterricola viridarii]SDR76637.1 Protein of unknown function [Microterricola viridarii]